MTWQAFLGRLKDPLAFWAFWHGLLTSEYKGRQTL